MEVKEGGGSGKTVALMAGQQDDIGFADYMLMAAGVAKGMKLKGIYGMVQNGAWAVISFADSPIKKPEDLVGRSVAVTADHKALLDLVLAVNKVPADKVSIRVVSAATRNTVFAQGQVDSFVSIVIGSPLDLVVRARQGKGKPLYFMPFEDFGVAPLGQGVMVHEQVLARSPTCSSASSRRRRARSATSPGRRISRRRSTSPCGARARPRSGANSVLLQWQEAIPRLATKNTKGKPYGWMSEADWQEASDILLKTGTIDKPVPAQNFFTNALLPQS